MKLVDRAELMAMPQGTIYAAWSVHNQTLDGPLMRLGEVTRGAHDNPIDWYEEQIGPRPVEGDVYNHTLRTHGLKFVPAGLQPFVANNALPDHVAIDNSVCREALFDSTRRYLVLDADDIQAIVLQLTSGLPDGQGRYHVLQS